MQLQFIPCIIFITILCEAKKRRTGKVNRKNESNFDEILNTGDVNPNKFVPVPFGHIYKEGFHPALKQPVDFLELDKKYPRDSDELKYRPVTNEKPRGFASPKDEFYFGEKVEVDTKNDEKKMWLDVVANHASNIGISSKRKNSGSFQVAERTNQQVTLAPSNTQDDNLAKEQYFSRSSFDLEMKRREQSYYNWTTCDEFGRNANFYPKDVINIDWVPFYTWSSDEMRRTVAIVYKFAYPTKKLVKKYKEQLGPYLNKTLDWESPKLVMKSDMEMLLVAADRKGAFDGIPYNEVPSSMKPRKVTLPIVNLRLKIVDPYLAMMFCEYQYATIMAISGNEPTIVQEIRSEAATLKFIGKGYPVWRDLETEMMVKRMERERNLQMEKERFIDADDQAAAELIF